MIAGRYDLTGVALYLHMSMMKVQFHGAVQGMVYTSVRMVLYQMEAKDRHRKGLAELKVEMVLVSRDQNLDKLCSQINGDTLVWEQR